MSVDARLEHAAAKPVVIPETVVIDCGKVFISETFLSACRTLGISVQPARPATPTDKPVVSYCSSLGLAAPGEYLLDHLPDVLSANRRHRFLARQAGPALVDAHRDARTVVTAWFTAADQPELLDRWIRRLEALPEDPFGHPGHPSPQRIALALYPEAVALTADYLTSRRTKA